MHIFSSEEELEDEIIFELLSSTLQNLFWLQFSVWLDRKKNLILQLFEGFSNKTFIRKSPQIDPQLVIFV